MNERIKDVLALISWSFITSSIVLHGLYERPLLSVFELALLLVMSIFAGVVLVDAKTIVLGYITSIALSAFIIYIFLILPALLGRLKFVLLADLVYQQAIVMLFRGIFPVPVFLCFIGVFIGGLVGERFFGLR